MALKDILAGQLRWAEKRWPEHQGRRTPTLAENLIMPMDDEVRAQFLSGAGREIGTAVKPGKMYSLCSSSALAYNFLAPWRGMDLQPLIEGLEVRAHASTISFERPFPHGLAPQNGRLPTPPNLDVVLEGDMPLAIECKFTEPYGSDKSSDSLKDAYFDGRLRRWTAEGLPRCQRLAEALGKDLKFHRLDAAQLLKHLLGIAHSTKVAPRLMCLWFDDGSDLASEHRDELARFAALLDESITFTWLSYQKAFASLRQVTEPMPGYFQYLEERYFTPASPPPCGSSDVG